MRRRIWPSLWVALFLATTAYSQTLLQRAATQYLEAEAAEAALNEKPAPGRSNSEYARVIAAYERVFHITPHTGYADNALTAIARLYEQMKDRKMAIATLQYLLKEYPQTQFRDIAERDIARLNGIQSVTAGAAIDNIRYSEIGNTARIVVDVTGDIRFKQGEAASPPRVFIDVSSARLNSALKGREWTGQSLIFQKIRVAQYTDTTVRIVIDGATMERVTAFALKDPDRLIIDVSQPGAPSAPPAITTRPSEPVPAATLTAGRTPTSAPGSPASTGIAPPQTTAAPPPVPPPAPSFGNPVAAQPPVPKVVAANTADPVRVVTPAQPTSRGDRSLIRSLGLKVSRVVIDPGHGGHDTGSIGPSGLTEKELVLDVANRLKALVEKELGLEVVMTRGDDTFIPLEDRTKIANQEQADLFISIHANSSRTRTVRGVETYFLNLNTQSREAVETAARENAASELSIHEQQDLLRKIMLNDKIDESREFAEHMQTAMSKRKDAGPNRGVKQAPFVVLIGADMPSILAEISFITNPQEERLLKTPQYRQQIAESLLQGVRSYSGSLSGTNSAQSQQKK
jgi:N-acetylmuramoyl-L-alanine amidase